MFASITMGPRFYHQRCAIAAATMVLFVSHSGAAESAARDESRVRQVTSLN